MGLLSFLSGKSQSKKINYEVLNSDLKVELKNELKQDSEKDFNSEFIRTTNLENQIIKKYGFDGVKLIFENRNSSNYYLLGNFPEGCPWSFLNNKSISESLNNNFKSIKDEIPNLLASLKERCRFIYTEKKEGIWRLHYLLDMKLYDNRDYYKVFTGGEPLKNPKPNENLQAFNWSIPNDLKKFYAIHNGFGEVYDANFILANEHIKVMAEMMRPICEKQNIKPDGYSFENLLEFFPDGSGNAQCFYKTKNNIVTVDWDHETWEISWEIGFFEFINERMSKIDEE